MARSNSLGDGYPHDRRLFRSDAAPPAVRPRFVAWFVVVCVLALLWLSGCAGPGERVSLAQCADWSSIDHGRACKWDR